MIQKLQKYKFNNHFIKKSPQKIGVYVFWKINIPLYIGKSINLRSRIKSYLSNNLLEKTKIMISQTTHFSYLTVSSEIEALLLESFLVNKLQTPYNIQLKDDKSPLYIKITKDKYPLVLTARKSDKNENAQAIFGPFESKKNVTNTLKIIRRIFPFSQHLPQSKPCIYSQMNLCNPCPSHIENANDTNKLKLISFYKKNIFYIKKFLNGDLKKIIKLLYKEMKSYSDNLDYENANIIKSKIASLEYIVSPKNDIENYLKNPNLITDIRKQEIKSLKILLSKYKNIKSLKRIECYDVAHLQGLFPTASMVTFINGDNEKKYYRHFSIKNKYSQNDIKNLEEIAKRRVIHFSDWGKPDLVIVDGGKGQVKIFNKYFLKFNIPVIGLAKRKETLVIPVYKNSKKSFITYNLKNGYALNLLQRLRNEAHRFARRLHHKQLQKSYFSV